ncbi:AMOT [Bugula neritina]|uniref:AMOT n=1 Tax=Bugula neritina TaxID=10212 RepID=A0A7J7K718_BUGNE|nr:AMOT [Bugula neritina]
MRRDHHTQSSSSSSTCANQLIAFIQSLWCRVRVSASSFRNTFLRHSQSSRVLCQDQSSVGRRLGGAEGRPVALEVKVPPTSKRHKPQSNSMPSQSSQLIQHTVNTQQSRSLDSSTSAPLDSKAHCGQLPQYWHLPNYGNFTGATQTTGGNVATQQTHPANSAAHLIPVYNQGDDQLLPPPPEYPGNKEDVRRSYEVLDGASLHHSDFGIPQSSSHPDLSQSVTSAAGAQLPSASHQSSHYSSYKSSRLLDSKQQQDFAALATRASQMVEILSEENKGLRNELENYYKKASRLHKIECELQKVHEAHNSLVKSSVKKEGLSNAIRMRQDLNIKNLEASNHQNHEKAVVLEKTVSDQSSMLSDMSVLINKHEETIRQLTSLTSEQKETINSHQIKVQALKKELESEKSQSKLLAEELAAYRSNASATIEEESEVKMAALSQNIKETERILHEEQVEKLRYMDEAIRHTKEWLT